jgi:hypothetical protein
VVGGKRHCLLERTQKRGGSEKKMSTGFHEIKFKKEGFVSVD